MNSKYLLAGLVLFMNPLLARSENRCEAYLGSTGTSGETTLPTVVEMSKGQPLLSEELYLAMSLPQNFWFKVTGRAKTLYRGVKGAAVFAPRAASDPAQLRDLSRKLDTWEVALERDSSIERSRTEEILREIRRASSGLDTNAQLVKRLQNAQKFTIDELRSYEFSLKEFEGMMAKEMPKTSPENSNDLMRNLEISQMHANFNRLVGQIEKAKDALYIEKSAITLVDTLEMQKLEPRVIVDSLNEKYIPLVSSFGNAQPKEVELLHRLVKIAQKTIESQAFNPVQASSMAWALTENVDAFGARPNAKPVTANEKWADFLLNEVNASGTLISIPRSQDMRFDSDVHTSGDVVGAKTMITPAMMTKDAGVKTERVLYRGQSFDADKAPVPYKRLKFFTEKAMEYLFSAHADVSPKDLIKGLRNIYHAAYSEDPTAAQAGTPK